LAEAPGRVFLYNFYTVSECRGQGLYPSLLLSIRGMLGRGELAEFIIDVNIINTASIKSVQKAGFSEVARITFLTVFRRWHIMMCNRQLGGGW